MVSPTVKLNNNNRMNSGNSNQAKQSKFALVPVDSLTGSPSSSTGSASVLEWNGSNSDSDLFQWSSPATLTASPSPQYPSTMHFSLPSLVIEENGERPQAQARGEVFTVHLEESFDTVKAPSLSPLGPLRMTRLAPENISITSTTVTVKEDAETTISQDDSSKFESYFGQWFNNEIPVTSDSYPQSLEHQSTADTISQRSLLAMISGQSKSAARPVEGSQSAITIDDNVDDLTTSPPPTTARSPPAHSPLMSSSLFKTPLSAPSTPRSSFLPALYNVDSPSLAPPAEPVSPPPNTTSSRAPSPIPYKDKGKGPAATRISIAEYFKRKAELSVQQEAVTVASPPSVDAPPPPVLMPLPSTPVSVVPTVVLVTRPESTNSDLSYTSYSQLPPSQVVVPSIPSPKLFVVPPRDTSSKSSSPDYIPPSPRRSRNLPKPPTTVPRWAQTSTFVRWNPDSPLTNGPLPRASAPRAASLSSVACAFPSMPPMASRTWNDSSPVTDVVTSPHVTFIQPSSASPFSSRDRTPVSDDEGYRYPHVYRGQADLTQSFASSAEDNEPADQRPSNDHPSVLSPHLDPEDSKFLPTKKLYDSSCWTSNYQSRGSANKYTPTTKFSPLPMPSSSNRFVDSRDTFISPTGSPAPYAPNWWPPSEPMQPSTSVWQRSPTVFQNVNINNKVADATPQFALQDEWGRVPSGGYYDSYAEAAPSSWNWGGPNSRPSRLPSLQELSTSTPFAWPHLPDLSSNVGGAPSSCYRPQSSGGAHSSWYFPQSRPGTGTHPTQGINSNTNQTHNGAFPTPSSRLRNTPFIPPQSPYPHTNVYPPGGSVDSTFGNFFGTRSQIRVPPYPSQQQDATNTLHGGQYTGSTLPRDRKLPAPAPPPMTPYSEQHQPQRRLRFTQFPTAPSSYKPATQMTPLHPIPPRTFTYGVGGPASQYNHNSAGYTPYSPRPVFTTPPPHLPPPPPMMMPSSSSSFPGNGYAHANNYGYTSNKQFSFVDATVIFRVENCLYRVHRHFFERHSAYLTRQLLAYNYSPISHFFLPDVTKDEFEKLLTIFYPSDLTRSDITTVAGWSSLLALSIKWEMPQIKALAFQKLTPLASSAQKIGIATKNNLSNHEWLLPAYRELCTRRIPLSLEEADELDLKTVVKIWQVQHQISYLYSSLSMFQIDALVKEKFGIQEPPQLNEASGLGVNPQRI